MNIKVLAFSLAFALVAMAGGYVTGKRVATRSAGAPIAVAATTGATGGPQPPESSRSLAAPVKDPATELEAYLTSLIDGKSVKGNSESRAWIAAAKAEDIPRLLTLVEQLPSPGMR